jgi:NADPH2:quinone reductase
MASISSNRNTSATPDHIGHWVITKFGTPSVMRWETWDPTSSVVSGSNVFVRIIVAGIAGVDNIQRAGGYPDPKAAEPGFTPGYDIVGEVVAIGPTVPKESGLNVGDRVASLCRFGGHATHIMLPYEDLIRIEPTDDPIKICALPLNYMTAWGMLKHSGVELPPGSSILIGSVSGGIGTALAQLIKAFNMDIKMLGTCSPSKFDYVRSLGVEPLDRNAPDLVDQVYKLTNGKGVDVAYDGVCSEESVKNFLAATKAEAGKVIVFGIMGYIAADGSKMLSSGAEILAKRLQPPRITFYGLDTDFHKKSEVAEFHAIVQKVRSGELNPVVAKLLRLSQGVEAHEMLISGGAIKGKMLFLVDAELAAENGI